MDEPISSFCEIRKPPQKLTVNLLRNPSLKAFSTFSIFEKAKRSGYGKKPLVSIGVGIWLEENVESKERPRRCVVSQRGEMGVVAKNEGRI
ncbi:hypothetical protein COLO4_37620 [Corchorus olitorius]|uniref:Uncharacterized protein n=1 Tax=Corchorus olitorius TaxID=93759 RepID=A0A1R3G0J7_9ROSI|nr:hypothetical protein COLO4_37620 [Corchorus olitorius]